jgi:type I restriction enzyme S subunit
VIYPLQSLSELGTIQTGSTPPTSELSYWGGDVPFVTPGELEQSQAVIAAPRTLSALGVEKSRLLQKDAIMVCCIGSLGKVGIAGGAVVTNQQINSIEFDLKKIWPKYGYYACKRLKSTLISMAPATTIAIVSKSKFGQLQIPVPVLSEQRRIAAILDQADAIRAKRREALAHLDSLAQAIFVEMFGDPQSNPMNWPCKNLKTLGKVKTGRTPPGGQEGMFGGAIPFVTPGDLGTNEPVKRTVTELGAAAAETVRAGSTLVCCIGTIGKMARAKHRSAFNQQINAVEWGVEIDDNYGLNALSFFKSYIASQGSSTTLPILKKSSFEKIAIPVPPIVLQSEFSERINAIEILKSRHGSMLFELDTLFAVLQHRAFRGEL